MNNRGFNVIVKGAILIFLIAEVFGKTLEKRDIECSINVNGDLGKNQPLLLSIANGKHDFLYPSPLGKGKLIVRPGESFGIACPGSIIYPNTSRPFQYTPVTCVGGNNFLLKDLNIKKPFKDISCEAAPSAVVRKIIPPTDVSCASGTPYEIGFELQGNQKRFYRMIDLCYDQKMTNTLYAHAKIFAAIGSAQKSFPRPAFRNHKLFGRKNMDDAYSIKTQVMTLAKILKSEDLARRYIASNGSYFFSRGHLIAKTDFVYGTQQRATFFYANAVPMWQNINGGNWATMERDVKTLASKKGLDFDVWVGGYEILQLDDINNNKRDIYLHIDANGIKAVPVPKILFKVVYNYKTSSGIVLLTANNPFLKTLTEEYRLCKDVCGKVNYLKWNAKIPERGLSYCCEIDDFRKAYPSIPRFTTRQLLV